HSQPQDLLAADAEATYAPHQSTVLFHSNISPPAHRSHTKLDVPCLWLTCVTYQSTVLFHSNISPPAHRSHTELDVPSLWHVQANLAVYG
ncbi:hypothetical protein J6590_088251, partial [Homalodisca vitripennis]